MIFYSDKINVLSHALSHKKPIKLEIQDILSDIDYQVLDFDKEQAICQSGKTNTSFKLSEITNIWI